MYFYTERKKMLVNSVILNRVGKSIDKIVTSYGKYKGADITMQQFFQKGKQVERHIQVSKPNYLRNNIKVRKVDGTFQTWG